ncbi:GH11763 [Drosophila grimshawi]|uniref:GH11763 n=1 Tax=Drosophila grimshawi TaxID=7222 RepID=B4K094_DROGR|nr:GH11763 [Drosophila grimshawi]
MLKSSNEEAYQTDRLARPRNHILEKLEMRLAGLREEMEIAQEWLANPARKELQKIKYMLDVRMRTIEKIIKTLEMEDKSWTCSDDIDELMFNAECLKGDIDIELSDLPSTSTLEYPRQEAPKVDIPHFNGNAKEWPIFFDLFTEVIHDREDISDTIKLNHLRSCLKGEASTMTI